MSGKPYPEGVSKILDLLEQHAVVEVRINDTGPVVAKLSKELRADTELREKLSVDIGDLLNKMDLASQGNFGFGGRMGWFLMQMRKQLLVRKGLSERVDPAKEIT